MHNTAGFSLIELLIALLLSALISILLIRHYLNAKEQGHYLQAAIEQSYELQLVVDLIRKSAKRAGFSPCANIDHLITRDARQADTILEALRVTDATIQINRMSEHIDTVLEIPNENQIVATHYHTLVANQPVLIADCYHAEVHQIAQVYGSKHGQSIRLVQRLAYAYHDPIYIGPWLEEVYFIKRSGAAQSSLFYQFNHAEELTRAVRSLYAQIEQYQGQTLLHLKLGLDHQQVLQLDTHLRSP